MMAKWMTSLFIFLALVAGVWLVRTATVGPDNERWLHEPAAAADLSKALRWADANPPSDAIADKTLKRLASTK